MSAQPRIRLFVKELLAQDVTITLAPEQSHYLVNVMRLREGAEILLFDGRTGEWAAAIVRADKKRTQLGILRPNRPFRPLCDVTLAFAPLKRGPTDFLVQKASELGAGILQPVMTALTNSARVNTQRLRAIAIEAAEQCGLVALPQIRESVPLKEFVAHSHVRAREEGLRLMYCDESGRASPVQSVLTREAGGLSAPWAILIGPEGGFDDNERALLYELEFARPVSLGPRIMRADTAALAAVTLWQSFLGDWRNPAEAKERI
jgi:16S rRNA (uracil1498-N3)-methyltransferase